MCHRRFETPQLFAPIKLTFAHVDGASSFTFTNSLAQKKAQNAMPENDFSQMSGLLAHQNLFCKIDPFHRPFAR